MRTALQIVSWIGMAVGFLGVVATLLEPAEPDAIYGLIGGVLFFTQGLLALMYIDSVERKK